MLLSSVWQNPEDYLSFAPDLIVVTKVKQKGWEGEWAIPSLTSMLDG